MLPCSLEKDSFWSSSHSELTGMWGQPLCAAADSSLAALSRRILDAGKHSITTQWHSHWIHTNTASQHSGAYWITHKYSITNTVTHTGYTQIQHHNTVAHTGYTQSYWYNTVLQHTVQNSGERNGTKRMYRRQEGMRERGNGESRNTENNREKEARGRDREQGLRKISWRERDRKQPRKRSWRERHREQPRKEARERDKRNS